MKFLSLLVVLVAKETGIARAQVSDSAAVVRTIRSALAEWVHAANRGDWKTAARIWAPDLVGWYPGQPDDTYAKEMERAAQSRPAPVKTIYQVDVVEVMVSGQLAVVRDIWRFTTSPGQKDSSVAIVRSFEVWKRQPDRQWKIARWISAPEPAASP